MIRISQKRARCRGLKTTEKSLLSKGLDFLIPPMNISYNNFMLPFELLYRDAETSGVSNLNKEFSKSRLRDSVFSSYRALGKLLRRTCPKRNLMH